MSDQRPDPPERPPRISDWRFSVVILTVLLIGSLVSSLVVYVQDGSIPTGFGNLVSALTGALIVVIGKRTL